MLLCVAKRQGRLCPLPLSSAALSALLADLRELAAPTLASWAVYLGFLGTQLALALVCPGPVVHGYPVTKSGERADDAALELVVPEVVAHGVAIRHAEDEAGDLGSFHTKRCRGGVERRQLAFKGVEGGD